MKKREALAFALSAEAARRQLLTDLGQEEYRRRVSPSAAFLSRMENAEDRLAVALESLVDPDCTEVCRLVIVSAWADVELAARPAGEGLSAYVKRQLVPVIRQSANKPP